MKEANFSDSDYSVENDVFYLHLNEIDPHYVNRGIQRNEETTDPVQMEFPRDPRNNLMVTDIVKHCSSPIKDPYMFQRFPRKSNFTSEEHRLILDAIQNIWRKATNDELMRKYAELQARIVKEYDDFDVFVKNHFISYTLDRKKNVNAACETLLIENWKKEVSAILIKDEPNHYRLESALPLKFHGSCDNTVSISHIHSIRTSTIDENIKITPLSVREVLQRTNKAELLNYYQKAVTLNAEFKEKSFLQQLDKCDIVASRNVLAMFLSGFHLEFKEWNLALNISKRSNTNVFRFEHLPKREMSASERIGKIVLDCVKGSILKHYTKMMEKDLSEIPIGSTSKEYKVKLYDEFLVEYFNQHPRNETKHEWFYFNCAEIVSESKKYTIGYTEECLEGVSVKVEYQPEFGAGQMNLSELIDEWLQLQFSNRNCLTRVRIDSEMQRSTQLRKVTLSDVEQDMQRLYSVNDKMLLNKLFDIFELISNFPCGKYLLCYKNTKSEIVSVYRIIENLTLETPSFDIKSYFENINYKKPFLEEISWTPIDPMEITPIHYKAKVAPRLFPFWGKNKKLPQERKRPIIEPNAVRKEVPSKRKKKKKQKRQVEKSVKVSKLQMNRLPKSVVNQESFSPNDLFDEEGHVKITLNINNTAKNTKRDNIAACTSDLVPINIKQYQAEAGFTPDLDQT